MNNTPNTHSVPALVAFAAVISTAALIVATLGLGCESGGSDGPPMEQVPVSEGNAQQPGAQPQAGGGGGQTGLPPGHPPIPGAQQGQGSMQGLPADHPAIPGAGAQPGAQGLPADHPPMPAQGGSQGQVGFMQQARMDAGPLRWTAPASWVEQPPANAMRLTQWQLGGSQPAGPAECYTARFSGGGTVQENIVRWVGQFTQPDGSSTADHADQFQAEINGITVTRLELTGTFVQSSGGPMMGGPTVELADYAMLAAVIESPAGLYFLKCTGPESTIAAERGSMMAFLESLSLAQ